MRSVLAAIMATAAGLVIASMLGVAAAEAPTGTSVRTVSVQGVASVPIDQSASAAAATAVYRQGMSAAVSDGQSKAEFLTSKAGATLGSVQSIGEGGGYIGCTGGEESGAEYQGEQPDFGTSPATIVQGRAAPLAEAPPRPPVRRPTSRRHKRKAGPVAKKAAATTCKLTTQVSLVYSIS
jgi:hypothetical protein